MIKTLAQVREIIDLNPTGSISTVISDRQIEVIRKSFNYLVSSKNNTVVYIADEVGLGKTYIAMGILALFRSISKEFSHRALIIVPKVNLQHKWQKELKLFMQQNYLLSRQEEETFEECNPRIYDRLGAIDSAEDFNIFRISSFSHIVYFEGDENKRKQLKEKLIQQHFLDNAYCRSIVEQAYHLGYFRKDKISQLRHLLAYLLNVCSPAIECLVVDEAHNYKHGPGHEDQFNAIRNEVTARYLGAIRDSAIFNDFEGLEAQVKFPLAKKVICLSATPKDSSLIEIKNQFHCFTNKHVLSECLSAEDIKKCLNQFLIRGNMEYRFGDTSYSRNQSREEHRFGNVNKSIDPERLEIKDEFEGVFWQLLQYKSLKHLQVKNGIEFEMGMLAGFESYSVDVEKKIKKRSASVETDATKEYEEVAHRNKKESEDLNVIKNIIRSYTNKFKKELPPHPKQSKFEAELLKQLHRQEKSLTFVRRVMTVHEMENRLLRQYEKHIVVEKQLKFSGKYKDFQNENIEALINDWRDRDIKNKLPDFFQKLLQRRTWQRLMKECQIMDELIVKQMLRTIYNENEAIKQLIKPLLVKNSINIPFKTEEALIDTFKAKHFATHVDEAEEILDDESSEADDSAVDGNSYFFGTYFRKGENGHPFRTKMYRENWFELDISYLNNQFSLFSFDEIHLEEKLKGLPVASDRVRKHQLYALRQNTLIECLGQAAILSFGKESTISSVINTEGLDEHQISADNSFLTQLLLQYCRAEMNNWLKAICQVSQTPKDLLSQVQILNTILRNIFRNGSGLLPSFVAETQPEDFSKSLLELILAEDAPFHFLLSEIKCVLTDYHLQMNTNFRNKSKKDITSMFRSMSPVVGVSGLVKRDRSLVAAQFRMPGFPYVLLSTDILREGEDLHTYCQHVYHYGVAWNPSDMEQRTGRVDRINSLSYRKLNERQRLDFNDKIQVFYPHLSQSIEVNQVYKLLHNINRFTETFNDITTHASYSSTVHIDEQISEDTLPKAIKHKIEALYDVANFKDELMDE
ncbi:DEAD/DEAH box helicase family protein [Sphingobacterium kitahiroshimense]|uniref:helicase-related protein n=1 Tax=Sphingobacterium sp. B16(2022) TaxID=2914044 RepID=UPI00143B1CD5|nr:helicase-related protein [Sphingobacterium sp. B16(2022)]NJI73217.1 DEAD/DEAH box helicase family protein [Sphingobacterium sp. B16(2022)]